MSAITVRQIDSAVGSYAGGQSSSGPVSQTYLESSFGFAPIEQGDALVFAFMTNKADTVITSVTDNYGNTWTHVPNSRVVEAGSDGNTRSVDMWRADDVAYVRLFNPSLITPFFTIAVTFTGTAITQWAGMIIDAVGINGGSMAAATTAQDTPASSVSFVSCPGVDGGADALYFAVGGWWPFELENNSVDAPFTFGSSPTGNFDQMNFAPYGGAYAISSGSQAATFRIVGGGTALASAAFVIAAFGVAGTGGNNSNGGSTLTDLSAKSKGDTLSSDEKAGVEPTTRDNGHTFDGVVYTGTVGGLDANGHGVGWIVPNVSLGDAAVPVKYSGEQQHVRAHPDNFTYTPRATGDRVKFVLLRSTGDDKQALLITKV